MIKRLSSDNRKQLTSIDAQIVEYHDSISSFSIIEDVNFQNSVRNKSENSLTTLNNNLKKFEGQLNYLNDLWIIKGLMQEIESYLINDGIELNDLESLHLNLYKLNDKLYHLDDAILIKSELKLKFEALVDKIINLITKLFNGFLPQYNEFHANVNNIEFDQFLHLISKFNDITEKISLNELINDYKITWEKILLKIDGTNFLNQTLEFQVGGNDVIDNFLQSLLNFINFINLINVNNLKAFYQLKLSNKLTDCISKNIDTLVSSPNEKLIKIIKNLQETNWNLSIDLNLNNFNDKLHSIFENWLMDNYIDKIRNKFKQIKLSQVELTEIKWEIDKQRINDMQQRLSIMERKIDRAISDESEDANTDTKDNWNQQWDEGDGDDDPDGTFNDTANAEWDDGWDDGWDETDNIEANEPKKIPKPEEKPTGKPKEEPSEQQATEDKEDGWDDGWDQWDSPKQEKATPSFESKPPASSENQEQPAQTLKTTTTIKISPLPNELIEILNDFQIESTQEIDLLISTILSLSSIAYPPIKGSFLQYNDLQYLWKNMGPIKFQNQSEILIKSFKNEIDHELSKLLISINISEDTSNVPVYEDLKHWFDGKFSGDLYYTNFLKFKEIIIYAIDFINNWIIKLILSNDEITEFKSNKLTNLIENFESIFTDNLKKLKDFEKPESLNKLLNYKFLIHNHLVDIIERFYQGEFYNLSTDELINVLKKCFVKSDLRDNYINEIVEFRSFS